MKNWRNRGGALAAALAVLLSLTGCGADVGSIGGADGPTAVFIGDEETESASGWEVLPEDWVCPVCGLGKDVFKEV